jgi:hypothetical protein
MLNNSDNRLYPLSQRIHDTVERLSKLYSRKSIDEGDIFHFVLDWENITSTSEGQQPTVLISVNDSPPERFEYEVNTPHPYTNWKGYTEALSREFKTFARNYHLDFKIGEKNFL